MRQGVVEANCQAVIAHLRVAAQGYKFLAASRTKGGGAVKVVVGETISSEQIQIVAQPIVYSNIEGVIVEDLAAGGDEIVAGTIVPARRIWRREQF